jgi:hypothetical protein
MFNKQLQALCDANELAIDDVRSRQRREHDIAERRWDYINGEVKATRQLVVPREDTIELSHADAPNVKVNVSLVQAVQALADHLNLGYLPEQEAEVVVINVGVE